MPPRCHTAPTGKRPAHIGTPPDAFRLPMPQSDGSDWRAGSTAMPVHPRPPTGRPRLTQHQVSIARCRCHEAHPGRAALDDGCTVRARWMTRVDTRSICVMLPARVGRPRSAPRAKPDHGRWRSTPGTRCPGRSSSESATCPSAPPNAQTISASPAPRRAPGSLGGQSRRAGPGRACDTGGSGPRRRASGRGRAAAIADDRPRSTSGSTAHGAEVALAAGQDTR